MAKEPHVKIARHQLPVDVAHENYEFSSQRLGEVVVNAHNAFGAHVGHFFTSI